MKLSIYSSMIALASIFGLGGSLALATTVTVNGNPFFHSDYELDAATNLTFADVANTTDNDPAVANFGAWYNPGGGGSSTWEGAPSPSHTFNSKQLQVTSSKSSPDPGPRQGSNYLRVYRSSSAAFSTLAESYVDLTGVAGTTNAVHFESAVYVTPFTSSSLSNLLGFYDDAFAAHRLTLRVDNAGNLFAVNSSGVNVDTTLDITLGQWNTIALDYTEGTASWSLSVNGGTAVGALPLRAAAGGTVGYLALGGGLSGSAATVPTIYFDAVPEPNAFALGAIGAVVAGAFRRRRS